ncbi:hypothetical protein [Flavobacterium granuli]|uniref:Uncharacterized protein n=1 Tax=Flavobacterium granuli TaxID=280093 RepID=A0ABX5EW29_9FLAO|nr:hypothetical protein [Flavobacterium granuli]PRZ21592.1 hypothetical protein BC624_10830 [Flavobacterium granuli]
MKVVKRIVDLLESKKCKIHGQQAIIRVINNESISIKSCCEKFKKDLEIERRTEITKQTREAIRKLCEIE